jgi:hypothetical protein
VRDVDIKYTNVNQVPVVRKFCDVFSEELPRLPPKRKMKFDMDLLLRTQPVSISLDRRYRLNLKKNSYKTC